MLFLVFQLGKDRFLIEARRVAEVVPLVEFKSLPQAPTWLAGLFDYRGMPVPIIDLSALALGRPARRCLSTRILLVHGQIEDGGTRLVGLIAEQATQTLRCDHLQFLDSGVSNDAAPYLGPVLRDADGLLQRIELDRLLSQPILASLGAPQAAA